MERAKIIQQKHAAGGNKTPSLSYAQATTTASNILKIKDAFPALPNKKILEIHDAAFPRQNNKRLKVQPTTKGPSRKQAIVPVSSNLIETIMGDANDHIFQINTLLKTLNQCYVRNLFALALVVYPLSPTMSPTRATSRSWRNTSNP